jgi:hypothetical protein
VSDPGDATLFKLRLLANLCPVLFANVLVYFHRNIAYIEAVRTVSTRARNPILITGIDFAIVRFESAPFQALKFFLTIANGASRPVVKDTPNGAGPTNPSAFDSRYMIRVRFAIAAPLHPFRFQ